MNRRTRARTAIVIGATYLIAVGGRAVAQQPPPASGNPPSIGGSVGYFGEHGQIAISGDMKFSVLHQSETMGGSSATSYEIQPALDTFVSTNVSVGGLLGIRRESLGGSDHLTTFTIGPRVGYNLFLPAPVSWWITVRLSYEHLAEHVAGAPDRSGYVIPITLYAPLLWHPVAHFFLGAGPFLETDLVSKIEGASAPKTTDFGLSSTVGGYFGGL